MEAPKQSNFSPSYRIFKWWTISTLAVNIAISALILLFLTVGLGKVRETGGLMDMLILFYYMVREAGNSRYNISAHLRFQRGLIGPYSLL